MRFHRPYKHKMQVPDSSESRVLTIRQAKFEAEGFASTGDRRSQALAPCHLLQTPMRCIAC